MRAWEQTGAHELREGYVVPLMRPVELPPELQAAVDDPYKLVPYQEAILTRGPLRMIRNERRSDKRPVHGGYPSV